MQVTVKPTRVEKGQPVTLTITIDGDPIEGVAGPDLSRVGELPSRFDFVPDELVGDVEGNRKVFRRAVFPRQAGMQTVPPISWSYFDPRREQYVTLRSAAIEIQVDPPSGGSARLALPGAVGGHRSGATALTLLAGGISPNYVNADVVLASQHVRLVSPVGIVLLAAAPLCCLAFTVTARRRARMRGDAAFARRSGAQRRALASLRRALENHGGDKQLPHVAGALAGYLTDRFNLPPGRATPAELRAVLAGRGVDAGMIDEIQNFFEQCEADRFMPGANHSLSPEQAAAHARTWIRQLERSRR
jgi:hypothetical protein